MEIKDKQGNKYTPKQAWKKFKQGIQGVTPLQQQKVVRTGTWIMLVGYLWGIFFSIIFKQYWLSTILIGGSIITIVGLIGNAQVINQMKMLEDMQKQMSLPPVPLTEEQIKEKTWIR